MRHGIMRCYVMPEIQINGGSSSFSGDVPMSSIALPWWLLLHLIFAAAAAAGTGWRPPDLPTHSNFLLSAMGGRRQRQLWCGADPGVCRDPEKNPWGGSAMACCGGQFCRDTAVDPDNCGGCGRVCAYGRRCCGGRCVDTSSDQRHCGRCGDECPPPAACAFGLCDYAS